MMAKFLPVAPWHILKEFQANKKIHENNAFLLAHDVVKHPEQFKELSKNWGYNTILDNSVIELGTAVDFNMVAEAAEISSPRVVVLPDVLEDASATIKSTISAWNNWEPHFANVYEPKHNEAELLFIPQGETLVEWLRCLETVMNETENGPKWIGIPRNTTKRIVESRYYLVSLVEALYPDVQIHLFGMSDHMYDDIISARHLSVTSMDSNVPFRMPQFDFHIDPGPRGDWWLTAKYESWMADNQIRMSKVIDWDLF